MQQSVPGTRSHANRTMSLGLKPKATDLCRLPFSFSFHEILKDET